MAFSYACLTLQRMVIPLVLVLAALFRPVGISFVYLLMFFISPFIPVATAQNFKGSVTAYLIILIALSTILLLCHVGLQVAIIAFEIQGAFDQCIFTEQLLRHIGFINFFKLNALAIVEWLIPEIAVFATSIASYMVTKKISAESGAVQQLENGEGITVTLDDIGTSGTGTARRRQKVRKELKINFDPLVQIAPMFCLATLFFAAALRPSVPGGLYFLFFLLSGSYWATFQSLQRGFAILIRFVMVVLVIHIISIVSYQTPWMQQNLDNSTLAARLVGLEPLVTSSCAKDIRIISYNTWFKLDSFLSPISMLFSYYVLALTSKNLIQVRSVSKPLSAFGQLENGTKLNRQMSINTRTTNTSKKDSWSKTQRLNMSIQRFERPAEPTETTPLVRQKKNPRGVDQPDRTSVSSRRHDTIGSDIPMEQLESGPEPEKGPSLFDQICYGIVSVGGFIYQNSYIFTNILMMAWSIVYHSWLTFVFLLWANVLWMIPNQRKAMMRSSPIIVIYAELLLIAQYIYGMNLTNEELPSSVNTTGINLQQIGFERPSENDVQPCIPLIVKTLFLLMFWVTLRQFFKEKTERKRHSTIADMVAPLQLTVSAAAADMGTLQQSKKTSKFLKKAGDIIKNLLVRLWIWLLILVIFLCAITGVKMTGFRICYMAMFLFFLLVFQSSSKAWVKVMYGFWLFLIFYAMSILTLIYTYQFDKFDQYWEKYLNISVTLQKDIGLKKYETKDLFLHLVSPTIIVILTVIQVHYFHKRFIAALQHQAIDDPKVPVGRKTLEPAVSGSNPSIAGRESTVKHKVSDHQHLVSLQQSDIQASIKDLLRRFMSEFKSKARYLAKNFKGVCWRFLEIHLIKAVYISAFVCCVNEVCVLHIAFCALCIIGLMSRSSIQIFISRIISLVVSIIILTKMIYQVQYISHEKYNVACNMTNNGQNNAMWFGLQKATVYGGLMDLIKKYIIFMVMVTLHAVVTLRQSQVRVMQGRPPSPTPKVLFPGVVRADAEKNLEGLTKFLFNYGFYKFGMECTLITLVALITFRQDIFATMYVVWLCILLVAKKSICARLWTVFQCFTATVIFVEYIILVGLPPGLCTEYPWNRSHMADALQKWAMLPGELHYSHVNKLIFDYILLLFITRQKRVFLIESRHENDASYPGGSNASVIHDIERLGHQEFENPTRDFLSTIRNYLDVIKNAVLCGFYWITLAVVFLAGTNISDLMAVGYLIGSFIFLWQGSDFYLSPIKVILRKWNILLLYNVLIITTKTFLQIGGCLYLEIFQLNACWLIHMIGIVCANGSNISESETEDSPNDCPELKSQSVLVWDSFCFAFIILQLRIFKSHYFCHIINDTKANTILAYRGAEIIEDLRQKQIEHRKQHEQEVLRKIKRKMEKIRATQQKMLRPIDKPTHFDEEAHPLLHSGSFSSCHGSGYHTPIDDDDNGEKKKVNQEEFASDIESKEAGLRPYVPGRTAHQIRSPSSGGLTISYDGFLDTNRLSFDSTAGSDVMPKPPSSDESCAVFSPAGTSKDGEQDSKGFFKGDRLHDDCLPMSGLLPPPTTAQTSLVVNTSGGSSVISSSQQSRLREHRRQSSVNAVSWNEPVSETCKDKEIIVPQAPQVMEDVPVTLRQKSLHRRHLSMGNATYSVDDNASRQRYSYLSAPDESLSRRPNSWGPIDNAFYSESLTLDVSRPTSHAESIRAGDYYMFEHMDEKFELDLIEDEADFLEDHGKIDESEKKMTRRKTLFDVCKQLSSDRKKSFSRQRSYASAPGSRIGIKSMDPDIPRASVISDPLVYPESCPEDDHEKTDKPKVEKAKSDMPSTSKDVPTEEPSAEEPSKHKTETDGVDATDKESEEIEPPNPILRLLEAFMVSVVIRLNRFSRNYRYVMKILTQEKKMLKESKRFEGYESPATVHISPPFATLKKHLLSDDEASNTNALNNQSNTEIHDTNTTTTTAIAVLNQPLVDINEIQTDTIDAYPRMDSESEASLTKQPGRRSSGVPGIRVMAPSIDHGLDETGTLSEEWSYEKVNRAGDFTYEEDFATRDHHIIIEALISSWYAILSNTDLICYIVVFVNQVINASIISLPLPLMVFLWGTLSLPRPTKTFWITLIAYTQALVLIKCIFQYRLIWSNYINLPNQPLAAAKIIGVEFNKNYANYDLLLLLVLFFHRFVLKSQGLWKSEYKVLQDQASYNKNKQDNNSIITANEEQSMILSKSEDATDNNTQDSNSVENSPGYAPGDGGIAKLTKCKYFSSYSKFFMNLVNKTRLPTDVYALMFLCDFINFFVLLFGFTAFGSQHGEGGFQEYLVENKVPIPFLIMLLVQFILIVIDRALYLRKALVPKIIFHFFSVIGIHIWMFFVIPAVTERSFYSLAPPIIFYIIKCFYLLFSSFQIKCGYPKRILGNFLTKGFSLVNMISFKVYMQVPFLYELRTVLDWVCTDTTMTLFDWLKMEDIFSDIYFIKCGRQMETDFPAMRAQKKAMLTKIALGGTIVLLIVVTIWSPLCLFALGNAVGQSNIPYEASATIRIGPYDPVYHTNSRESIFSFNSAMFMTVQTVYKKSKPAITFLSNYDEGDIAAINLKSSSPSLWMISPPDKERLLDDLINNRTLTCRFTYSFTRTPPVKGGVGEVSHEITQDLDQTFEGRQAMIDMLLGNSTTNSKEVIIPNIFPKFIKVHNAGDLSVVTQLMPDNEEYRPLVLRLHTSSRATEGVWWDIQETCNDPFYKNTLSQLPYAKCEDGVAMYTFNDKKFPSTFSFLTAGGIISLYTTFVLFTSRLLKSFIGGQSRRIMYEDLPYVDRVLQLCLDIYLVREALEFALEEDLFAKLLFLYRSPETMIKWTRPKEDVIDDETDTESVRSKNSHRRMD